jgi:serine/threonine-protein kinase
MSLSPGARIGPYEVIGAIGEGGMGQVYRARDTKLNRDVALKILPEAFAADPDRLARFTREAQTLATLNHPNIAHIHGFEDSGAVRALVMELVPGEDLSTLIAGHGTPEAETPRGLSIDDALSIARQIAEALEAAHERGIIHRDLKPANIKVRDDGTVKVLDFGLAKALDPNAPGATSDAANSPTLTARATQLGMILGTAAYMSPEQAKGKPVDKRADIWAFGVVLYEMLTGRGLFVSDSVPETLAHVMTREADLDALPAATPARIRSLIARCLRKDPKQRLRDIGDARLMLSDDADVAAPRSSAGEVASGLAPRGPRSVRLPIAVGLAALAVMGTVAVMTLLSEPAPAVDGSLARFSIPLPDGDEVTTMSLAPLAIAPNGTSVVYVGLRVKSQLFIREFAESEPRALPGTEGGRTPFYSPDSRWIGFFAQGKLKKITVGGTGLQELADAADSRGGAWHPDDTIYFSPVNTSGLWKVSASGGKPVEFTQPDRAAGEITHRWPTVVAGGQSLLFTVWTGPGPDEHRIERLTLADRRRTVLVQNAESRASAVGGFLVYAGRSDSLLAVPWQPTQEDIRNVEPVVLPFEAQIENEGVSAYAVSDNGTFAYVQGNASRRAARVVWVDRAGKATALPLPEKDYIGVVISPDGNRAVVQIKSGVDELWMYEFATQSMTPFTTTGGSSQAPVWSHDGRYVIYRGTRAGYRNLFRRAADGTGGEERLTTKLDVIQTPTSVSADGKWVVFMESGQTAAGGADLFTVALDGGDPTPRPVVATPALETNGQVSPDGRWIAYESTLSGRSEIWVQPLATAGPRQQVSRDGGSQARWSRDGRELIFTALNAIMAIGVPATGSTFTAPRLLFEGRFRPPANGNTNYDIARDGRLLHVQQVQPNTPVRRIEVLLNGLAALKTPK